MASVSVLRNRGRVPPLFETTVDKSICPPPVLTMVFLLDRGKATLDRFPLLAENWLAATSLLSFALKKQTRNRGRLSSPPEFGTPYEIGKLEKLVNLDYIYIRRRCCEMNLSIQEESCLFCWRKGDERVGESFQPWNIIGIVFSCLFLVWFIFKKPVVVGFKRMFNIWFWNKVASSSRFYFSFYFSRGINVCYLCFLLILMARKD